MYKMCVTLGKVTVSLLQLIRPVFCHKHAMLVCHVCLLKLNASRIVQDVGALLS